MVDVKPYSQSLLELAIQENVVDTIRTQLEVCSDLWKENTDLTLFLKHPKVLKAQKEEVIKQVVEKDIHPLMSNFLSVLAKNDCAAYVPEIFDEFEVLVNELDNKEVVWVESAMELDSSQQEQLKSVLSEKLKKNIDLNVQVNPELIGGLRVKTKEFTLDNTLLSKAEKMKETIKNS